VLALSEVEDGHDGGLLVLRGVALEDLCDDLLVLGGELEGDVGVVLRSITVLQETLSAISSNAGSTQSREFVVAALGPH
jgi:hypothetical protein